MESASWPLTFPGHGESPVDSRLLAVERCLDDLAVAEERVRQLCPAAEIVYFGSSFGGYVTLHYLASRPHAGGKAFLRSAAVDMPGIYRAVSGSGPADDKTGQTISWWRRAMTGPCG